MCSLFTIIFVEHNGDESLSSFEKDDRDLILDFKLGDRKAFEKVFEKYREALYRFAFKYLKDEETSMDVVQECFIRLLSNKENIDPDKGVKNLLFTIAVNYCYDMIKRNKIRKSSSIHVMEENGMEISCKSASPEQLSQMGEMEDALGNIVDSLPSKQKDVLLMKKMGGLTFKEIGEAMGFSERYAKKLIKTALDTIIESFDTAGFTKEGMLTL